MAFRAEVAFRSVVASALESAVCIISVEVHLFLCVSSMSADSLGCHCGRKGIRQCGFEEAWPGVFLSQPSPFYALETQNPASSLLRLLREVS